VAEPHHVEVDPRVEDGAEDALFQHEPVPVLLVEGWGVNSWWVASRLAVNESWTQASRAGSSAA
jgi:hypothetical protein